MRIRVTFEVESRKALASILQEGSAYTLYNYNVLKTEFLEDSKELKDLEEWDKKLRKH